MIDSIPLSTLPVGSAAKVAGVDRSIASGGGAAETGDFGALLKQFAVEAAGVVKNAEAVSIQGVRGQASVQQVVEAVMSAEQTLQGALAIRDKVVAAYLEISRMSI